MTLTLPTQEEIVVSLCDAPTTHLNQVVSLTDRHLLLNVPKALSSKQTLEPVAVEDLDEVVHERSVSVRTIASGIGLCALGVFVLCLAFFNTGRRPPRVRTLLFGAGLIGVGVTTIVTAKRHRIRFHGTRARKPWEWRQSLTEVFRPKLPTAAVESWCRARNIPFRHL